VEGGAEPNPKGQALFARVICRAGAAAMSRTRESPTPG
jgi:hypothetical protein